MRRIVSACLAIVFAALLAAPARAELKPWDQAKVTALAKQLSDASSVLYDAFNKQPKPGSSRLTRYYRLREDVRRIRAGSRYLARALESGEGLDQTQPKYDDLMQTVRRAQDNAGKVFITQGVQEKADAARAALNQITPYYAASATPPEPTR